MQTLNANVYPNPHLVCVWIQFILLKTENWKQKQKKKNLLFGTVHWPKYTVHGQWTMHNTMVKKKKKKAWNADAQMRTPNTNRP